MMRWMLFLCSIMVLGGQVLGGKVLANETIQIGERLTEFSLYDIQRRLRTWDDYSDAKAIALIFTSTQCPLVNLYIPTLKAIDAEFASQGARLLMINSDRGDSFNRVAGHAWERGIRFPVLKDFDQSLAKRLGAERTPEAFVFDADRRLIYRGRIDDQYSTTHRRPKAKCRELIDAMKHILSGKILSKSRVPASGCVIDHAQNPFAKKGLTYHGEIADIVSDRCFECHQKGRVGQIAFGNYRQVKRFSKTIREVVLEQRMPPWFADPHYGEFLNDRKLSDAERDKLLAWIDEGCIEGEENAKDHKQAKPFAKSNSAKSKPNFSESESFEESESFSKPESFEESFEDSFAESKSDSAKSESDFPKSESFSESESESFSKPFSKSDSAKSESFAESFHWSIGIPDRIFWMPKEERVPASGVVDYQYYTIDPDFTEEVWVQAAEARPGNAEVVHHIIVYIVEPGRQIYDRDGEAAILVGWAPGDMPSMFPEGVARRIAPGSKLRFELHYTPNGKEAIDRSSIGIRFSKTKPKWEVHTNIMWQRDLRIPPHTSWHVDRSSYEFADDARILSLMPHMHLRGVAARYVLRYPSGKEETILSVPSFDFNWQSVYRFKNPLEIPKGTRLTITGVWDNSADNPNNPNANREVLWGEQTWDEMLNGWVDFVYAKPNVQKELAATK